MTLISVSARLPGVTVKLLAKNSIEITEKRVIEILNIIKSDKPNIRLRLDNCYIVKEYNIIKIKPIQIKNEEYNYIKIDKDGVYNFLYKKAEVKKILNKDIDYKKGLYIKAKYPITIRTKKDGDFIYTYPDNHKKYLRKIFIDLKIPSYERNTIPVITSEDDNNILALYLEPYGLNRISNEVAVSKEDEYLLKISFYNDNL